MTPRHEALAYAAKHGFTGGEPDLILWLKVCLVIYFLDKHEAVLPESGRLSNDDLLGPIVEDITRRGLVHLDQGTNLYQITKEGRQFIGNLLAETEEYIDRYDILKDVVWDEEAQIALFGTGQGEDLRVEAFMAEGLDPVRAVFLLRLYDGTLDQFVGNWVELVNSEESLNLILEPVVNRSIDAGGSARGNTGPEHGDSGGCCRSDQGRAAASARGQEGELVGFLVHTRNIVPKGRARRFT